MVRGLVESVGGWNFAVGHRGQSRVSMLINFDAKRDSSYSTAAGSRTIQLSQLEALDLADALRAAAIVDPHTTGVRR